MTVPSGAGIPPSHDLSDHVALIRAHLLPEPSPVGPEGLTYHAARPEVRVSRLAEKLGTTAEDLAPYWAWLWPGGAGLIHYLMEHPDAVRGRRVIDLGAGSGLTAITALRLGAAHALCIDPDPMARAACLANAALNGVAVDVAPALDPRAVPDADILLAGDVFYGEDVAQEAAVILTACHSRGIRALVGDIGRHWLPKAGLTERAAYQVRDVGDAPSQPPWTVRVMDWTPGPRDQAGEDER